MNSTFYTINKEFNFSHDIIQQKFLKNQAHNISSDIKHIAAIKTCHD